MAACFHGKRKVCRPETKRAVRKTRRLVLLLRFSMLNQVCITKGSWPEPSFWDQNPCGLWGDPASRPCFTCMASTGFFTIFCVIELGIASRRKSTRREKEPCSCRYLESPADPLKMGSLPYILGYGPFLKGSWRLQPKKDRPKRIPSEWQGDL